MKFKEFKIVQVDLNYLQALHDVDSEVMYRRSADYAKKPFLGILVTNHDRKYVIPLTSAKEKHKSWADVHQSYYMLYYNGEVVGRLKPVFTLSLFGVIFAGSALFLIYGIWLTRQTGKIAKEIGNISRRVYKTIPEKGTFGSVYMALNKMNEEIRHSDQIKEETDRVRREWITNITHDLKTPLSPVNGVGIKEAEQAELFTRYYRGTNTKEKSEGSGLGLAIAKQIVVLHGGDIAVKSKFGEGTEFSILFSAN